MEGEALCIAILNEDGEKVAKVTVTGFELELELEYGVTNVTDDDDPEGITCLLLTGEEEDDE